MKLPNRNSMNKITHKTIEDKKKYDCDHLSLEKMMRDNNTGALLDYHLHKICKRIKLAAMDGSFCCDYVLHKWDDTVTELIVKKFSKTDYIVHSVEREGSDYEGGYHYWYLTINWGRE